MMKLLPFLLMIACLAVASPALCSTEQPLSLTMAKEKVTGELKRLDNALKHAAETLGATGRMVTVEPAPFRKFEGSDISNQEQVERVKDSRKPVLSDVFRAVEGFEAADAEYCVFRRKRPMELM